MAGDVQQGAMADLIKETARLYENYLSISTVADLSQLGHFPADEASVYVGPAPVGLVVTGA